MKKLLALLFSMFVLSSPSVFADDISDFEIEGISIGDSLLDYMTEDEILQEIELNKHRYLYLKEPHKYAHISFNKDLHLFNGRKKMSKEIIDPNSIRANTPDWQEGYQQGLLVGTTRAIVLCRSLQRSLVPEKNVHIKDCIIDRRLQWEILEQAMELIAEKIETNNDE